LGSDFRQQAIVLIRAALELVRAAFDPDNPFSKTMHDTIAVVFKIIDEIITKLGFYVIGECLPRMTQLLICALTEVFILKIIFWSFFG
jgi:hypothetical protein